MTQNNSNKLPEQDSNPVPPDSESDALTTRPSCLLILGDSITSKWNQALRWNPLGNWVILIFSGQKPCTQKNFKHIASFLTLFKGYSCNKFFSYGSLKQKTSKASNFTTWNFMHDDFTCAFSILWNLKFIFSGSHKKYCLWCYYR